MDLPNPWQGGESPLPSSFAAAGEPFRGSDTRLVRTMAGPATCESQTIGFPKNTYKEYHYICNRQVETCRSNTRKNQDTRRMLVVV